MKTILKKWQMLLMLVLTLGITACSDDNGGNGDNVDDDGDNLSDILFENGTQLGNGADEMEINGNYKLPKGVYVMKGWLYITDGSSLEIEAGTVIKGDKATKAAIIAEPGGVDRMLLLCLLPTNLSVRVNPEIGEVLSCAEKR